MKAVDQVYREAIFTALNGNLTYNSNPVNVYSAEADTTDKLYVIIGEATNVQDNTNKKKFCTASTVNIEIVHYQEAGTSYKVINDVYDQMMDILIPAPYTAGFIINTDFQACNVEVTSTTDLYELSTEKIIRKVIRLRTEIFQSL